jgi:DNA-binding transcriptional MerR regulator
MITVSQLAKRAGLSRSTLLYYESIGLLKKPARTGGNYRFYTERDQQRLHTICAYRNAGLKLDDIRTLLNRPQSDAAAVLKRRLLELDAEIAALRGHQQAILKLLELKALRKTEMITKEKWVSIMHGCGFTEEQMMAWHTEFERAAPDDHQEFLEFLHIPADEITSIRARSRRSQSR